MSRRKSRIIAFQALYSWDVGGVTQEDILKCEWVEEKDSGDPEELSFARLLIAGTFENIKKIDEVITAHLSPKWDFDRLNKISLAILRMSVYSILFQPETHPSIVIDEAVDISKEYGSDDSYKFINGLLDSVAKEKTAQ